MPPPLCMARAPLTNPPPPASARLPSHAAEWRRLADVDLDVRVLWLRLLLLHLDILARLFPVKEFERGVEVLLVVLSDPVERLVDV